MRRWFVSAALMVTASSLAGDGFDLSVRVTRMPSQAVLLERCDGRPACTRFVSERLSAQCSARDTVWTINTTATQVALVYLLDSAYIHHEFLHIYDMKKGVATHLIALEAAPYTSRDECEEAARTSAAQFREAVREIASASMAYRR